MTQRTSSAFQFCTVAVTVAVTALAQPVALRAQRPEPILANAAAEGAAVERALQALNSYQKQYASAAGAKTAVTPAQMTALRSAAGDSKREYQNLERAAVSLMAKLKAANKWNDAFDAEIEKRMKDVNMAPQFVTYFKAQGGARAIIERHARLATEAGTQLDVDIDALPKRTLPQIALDALLGTPVMAACLKCHCGWYALGAAIALTSGIGAGAALGMAAGGLACVSR